MPRTTTPAKSVSLIAAAKAEAETHKVAHDALHLLVRANPHASVDLRITKEEGWVLRVEFYRKINGPQVFEITSASLRWQVEALKDEVDAQITDAAERKAAAATVKAVWERMTPAEKAAWKKTSRVPDGCS